MKETGFIVLFLSIFVYLGYTVYDQQSSLEKTIHNEIKVLLVYDKNKNSNVLKAYKSVLEEEGVPFGMMSVRTLIKLPPDTISMYVPAIIFPDSVNQYIPNSTDYWIERYVKSGGKVALIYDVDTRGKDGRYKLSSSYLDRIVGLNFAVYEEKKDHSYQYGNIYFKDKRAVNFFEIPTGKVNEELSLVGYQYGKLLYPMLAVKVIDDKDQIIYARDGKKRPVLVQKNLGEGALLYVNIALGYVKGRSDDLLLRSILKTFLFKIAHVPHIVSSPNGKGTLVINWHVDSSVEYTSLQWSIDNHYFREDLNQTFHITAGPDTYTPQDGLGFDVLGKGKDLIKELMRYGSIGSHGGWIHNWFSKNIKEKKWTKEKIKTYIEKNNQALESVIGYKPVEYSAPNGVFPPMYSIDIMKELGFKAYYYVGDSGSAPNRTFDNGKMLTDEIIAFPVMTFGKNASLKESHDANVSKEKMQTYYKELIDYIVANRSVRLFYSHPHDIQDYGYKDTVQYFLNYITTRVQEGKLQTRTMTNISDFIIRLVDTQKNFILDSKGIHAQISTPTSLDEMVLAIPKRIGTKKLQESAYTEDNNYYYIPLMTKGNEAHISLLFRPLSRHEAQDIKKDKK